MLIYSADLAERMESYLEAELGTHTCKICFELMVSPVHTPVLLFPCGHTFCKVRDIFSICMYIVYLYVNTSLFVYTYTYTQACIESHEKSQSKNEIKKSNAQTLNYQCPYCRTFVVSTATNQSLKDLIGTIIVLFIISKVAYCSFLCLLYTDFIVWIFLHLCLSGWSTWKIVFIAPLL
jgi:hypothetical protein